MYAAGFLSALSIVIHQAFGKLHQVNCFSHQHFHRIFACLGSSLKIADAYSLQMNSRTQTLHWKSSDKELGVGHSSRMQSAGDLGFPVLHLSCTFRAVSGVGIF